MYPQASEVIDALAHVSAGFETTIVLSVRPIADFVESYYLQTIHEGAAHTFDSWFAGIDANSLAWDPIVDRLDEAFGRLAVEVGDFREIESGQNRFLRGFLVRAGTEPWTVVRHRYRSNPSISAAGLEHALARPVPPESVEERRARRRHLQTHFSNVNGPRARPVPAEIRARLESMTAAEYERLARRASNRLRRTGAAPR